MELTSFGGDSTKELFVFLGGLRIGSFSEGEASDDELNIRVNVSHYLLIDTDTPNKRKYKQITLTCRLR